MSRALVVGGYGAFGGLLSRRLAEEGWDVIVAGRTLHRAEAFCATTDRCRALRVDRREGISAILGEQRPDVVIDASGPFQRADYRIVEECIGAGTAYLDLADSRAFVTGVRKFHSAASQARTVVISGASSVPALSGAVIRHLAEGLDQVTSVEIAITASSRAAAGTSVTEAIIAGVGQPLSLWRGQRWTTAYGWQELRSERITCAGAETLSRRVVALADVPDLELVPERVPGRPAVAFRAGTESALAVMTLGLLSWPVRWAWVRSIRGLAPLLARAHRFTALFGGDRSGMTVRLFGTCGNKRIERRWSLIADHGDGPKVPTLAAAILARRAARGSLPPGAYDAGSLLHLEEFEPLFRSLSIVHDTAETEHGPSLYRRIMGPAFDQLDPAVQTMHEVLRDGGAHGRATVELGSHPIAHLVSRVMGFPKSGDCPVHVHFIEESGAETWVRDFGGSRFSSRLSQAGGRLVERFGPLRFHFDLIADKTGLKMEMKRWSMFGLPLPLALGPRSAAREWSDGSRFHFDVPVALPLIGPVIRYTGWLERP